ncbi:MAG: dihydrofolate reductase [Candidatus Margulisiibacteriota bacterium]|nr:MAG: dihydrofolate reductase [Candidatus Margulisiibacteriota bacterium]
MTTYAKVILYIASSLDGYIARENGDVDWLYTDQDYGYLEFIDSIDIVIMGRVTYEQVLGFGEFPYKQKRCFVFSPDAPGKRDNVEFVNERVEDFITRIKPESHLNIWLIGGSNLLNQFVQYNLIDEYIVSVHPILLGNGIPLFEKRHKEIPLQFTKCISYSSGLAQLYYTR